MNTGPQCDDLACRASCCGRQNCWRTTATPVRNMYAYKSHPLVPGAIAGLGVQSKAFAEQMIQAHITPDIMRYEALKAACMQ